MIFDLDRFISKYVIKREKSLFGEDIENNKQLLWDGIHNKTVLVIGGAGTIGSSFIRALLPFEPLSLVVVDINENALAELTRDLRSTKGMFIPKDYLPYPMDYNSPTFVKMFKDRNGFDIVANFSAHKHVRSEKDIYSIEALIQNNVLHAKNLLELLSEYPPENYFCVSTDKAANPVNIMGASKRIMEDLIFSYSDKFHVKTARFANVAFSNGSLPAGFIARLQKFQPLSSPSDVKRYFVSPNESGQICLLACILGENREIFYPRLEEAQMLTFDQIARDLLESYGYGVLECNSDEEAVCVAYDLKNRLDSLENTRVLYPVHFSKSDTSGEKQYEEFYTQSEIVDEKTYNALGVIKDKPIPNKAELYELVGRLQGFFDNDSMNLNDFNKSAVVKIIGDYLDGFEHIETGKSLDEKM